MIAWSDEEFLSYVEIHSRTERALFSGEHVIRFCKLAGRETNVPADGFYAMHYHDISDALRDARSKR